MALKLPLGLHQLRRPRRDVPLQLLQLLSISYKVDLELKKAGERNRLGNRLAKGAFQLGTDPRRQSASVQRR